MKFMYVNLVIRQIYLHNYANLPCQALKNKFLSNTFCNYDGDNEYRFSIPAHASVLLNGVFDLMVMLDYRDM